MMTAAQFKADTGYFRSQHKSPIAQDIQMLLVEYERGTTSPNRKLKLLVLIYFLCLEYVRSKGKGNTAWDPTAHAGHKIPRLMQSIEAEFQSQAFQNQFASKKQGESFKGGQQSMAAQVTRGGNAVTTLKGAYGTETILPTQNLLGKYNLNTNVKRFGMSLLYQSIEMDYQVNQNMGMQQSEAAAHQAVAAMSFSDLLRRIHQMWSDVNLGGYQFNFLTAAQRAQYEATCAGGVISCNGTTPYTTGQGMGGAKKTMYVLDTAQHLYIADGIVVGNGTFNHSSMLSGAPVLCAGTLSVNAAGRLTYIDNDSGHYKPNTLALLDAVDFLRNRWGLNTHSFAVMDKVTGREYKTAMGFQRSFRFQQ